MKNLDDVNAEDTTGTEVKSSRICSTQRAQYSQVLVISGALVAKRRQRRPESTTASGPERRRQDACTQVKWTQTPTKKVTYAQIVPLQPLRKHYRQRPPNGFRRPAISMRYGVIAWIRRRNDMSRRSLLGHHACSNRNAST